MTNSAIKKIDGYLNAFKAKRRAIAAMVHDLSDEDRNAAIAMPDSVIEMLEDIRAEVVKNDTK